jgi:hypothetical protein
VSNACAIEDVHFDFAQVSQSGGSREVSGRYIAREVNAVQEHYCSAGSLGGPRSNNKRNQFGIVRMLGEKSMA